ncbi:MAG TPA: hypothetical protein VFA46_15195 [Actinomycetes bacterium]|nr:hypothetical protein [Actinomycetes bacterium]
MAERDRTHSLDVLQAASGDTRTRCVARLDRPARALHLAILRAVASWSAGPWWCSRLSPGRRR